MYLPRQTSFHVEQRPRMGRSSSSASLVSLHVHNSYLASQVRDLSSHHGLGLANDHDQHSADLSPTHNPYPHLVSSPSLKLDTANAGVSPELQKHSTTTSYIPSSRSTKLQDLFAGSMQSKGPSAPTSSSSRAKTSKYGKPSKHGSLRGYAESRWQRQELLETKILRATDIRRLEWEAKAAMLHESYPLAILLLYRAAMLGSASSAIELARLYAYGLTKGNRPVVVMVYRDPLRSLAWSLEALAIIDSRLSAQIKAARVSTQAIKRLSALWDSPVEATSLLLRAVLAPQVAVFSPSQRSALPLPRISKLAGSQSAGRDPPTAATEDHTIQDELWTRLEDVAVRLSSRLTSERNLPIASSFGPDDEDEEHIVANKLNALSANLKLLQAILQSRSFVLDPVAERLPALKAAWLECSLLNKDTPCVIESEMDRIVSLVYQCAAAQAESSSQDPTSLGKLWEPVPAAVAQWLPELAVPDMASSRTTQVAPSQPTEPKPVDSYPRRDSLRDLEPEDVDTVKKNEASVRPALTMRLSTSHAAPSASVASVFASGQALDQNSPSPHLTSRQQLGRTISHTGSPPAAIDLSSVSSFADLSRSSAEPPSPSDSVRTGFSFTGVRPRRPSSVVSVTPSLLFPPGKDEPLSSSPSDERAIAFPSSPQLSRSRTSSQVVSHSTSRPNLTGGAARPRVTSLYSSPSLTTVSAAQYSTSSTSASASDSLQGIGPIQPRRRTGSNASLSRSMAHMISKTSPSIAETPERHTGEPSGEERPASKATDTLRRLKGQRSGSSLSSRFVADSKAAPVPPLPSWARTPSGSLVSKSTGTVSTSSEDRIPMTSTSSNNLPSASQRLERLPHTAIPSVVEDAEAAFTAPKGPSFSTALVAGAMAGMTVDLLFYPIDTIKTRLQSAQGFLAAGGFKGVYRGLGSTAVGSAPGASVFFTTYESMKPTLARVFPDVFGERGSLGQGGLHMASASVAETAACLIRVPTEVVKSRQQTSAYGAKTSTFEAFKMVFKESGVRGYYRGFAGTVMREIPFTCIQFPLYERLKLEMSRSPFFGHSSSASPSLSNAERVRNLPTWQAGLAGSIAGAIAAGLTTPLDVVKTRIMLHRKAESGAELRIIPTLTHIARNEGPRALFSGFVPRVTWIGLGGAVFLGTFDAGVKVLG